MSRAREVAKPTLVRNLPQHDWIAVRRFTSDRATSRAPIIHDHASVALYLAGRARFWVHGHYTLGPGDLLLIPDATPHYLVEATGVQSVGVSLCLPCMSPVLRDHLTPLFDTVRRGGCAVRRLTPDASTHVEHVLQDLEGELGQERVGGELVIDACVSLLTAAMLRAADGMAPERRAASNPVVTRALEFVRRHGSAGISLRDVAEHVGRSPAHVASLVKNATGVTVVGWITQVRMNASRQLLLHTEESVDAIAERCGFASPSHFHRAFKRAHRVPPGEWRRAHRVRRSHAT